MKINVFVHTIEDVNYFFNNIHKEENKYIIYATHAGVFEYIKESYNKEVVFLSALITQEEINKINVYAEKLSIKLISSLDKKYSQNISKKIDIENINYFSNLYSYSFPFLLTNYLCFKKVLFKINNDSNNDNVIFDYIDPFYHSFSIKYFLKYFSSLKDINIIWYKSEVKEEKKGIKELIIKLINNFDKASSIIIDYFYEYQAYISKGKKTILYMDNLYDLSFLKRLKKFRLIAYHYQAYTHKFSKISTIKTKIDNISIDNKEELDNFEGFLSRELIKSFNKKIRLYGKGLKILDELLKKDNVDLSTWGSPPDEGFKSLLYDYCKVKNIPVVGVQHGGSYIDQSISYHYRSDFQRCSHYISYGFTKEDLKNNLKNKEIEKLEVYPFGSTKFIKHKKLKKIKRVDVLFPITNTISMLDGINIRVKPDILHTDQIAILNILEEESRNNITTLVKPFKNTNIWQTSVYLELKKLQFSKVEWDKTLIDTLNEVSPKCVIIEYMSTPLYEILGSDVEIFLFVRESDNLTNKARKMLNKRVYIVGNVIEFNDLFKKWINEKLPQKRDFSYFNYYINKTNTKSNIIKLIDNL